MKRFFQSTLCLLLGMIIFNSSAFSQDIHERNCAAHDIMLEQLQDDPMMQERMDIIEEHTTKFAKNGPTSNNRVNGVITIPVVVHVIYQTSAQNISEAQINSQMQVLNDDFRRTNSDANNTWSQAADTEIEFCLATVDPNGNPTSGITRKSSNTSAWGCDDDMKKSSQGGVDPWDTDSYLNMWVCNIGSCGQGTILGYAQLPGGSAATDGVVMSPQFFGTVGSAQAPFDGGRTTTHEVGHWLNLRHIWGDGNCNADDFVTDTPTSDAANYGCASSHVSCNSTDMVQNYMDYSDDGCMNLFTAGQKTRMRALFDAGGFRAAMLNSTACGGGGSGATCSDGIQNGSETGVDCGGSCAACPSSCSGTEVTISITFDNYPEETSWSITNSGGSTVASGGTYASQADGSTLTITECLSSGCYDFTINDAYGDGICCSYGNGSYSVTGGGSSLASGGSFTSSETTNFCVGGSPAPTCTDGIQNGTETGVDCGGSCTACVSCFDGIQNGSETGVDCGGSCSAACVSCFDGIQNGSETGVDCGGSCSPCATCNAPGGLGTSGLTSTEVTMNWNSVSSAVSYDVRIRLAGTTTWYDFNATTNSLGLTGLTAGTTYEWQVRSNCSGATSGYSSLASFTAPTSGGGGGACSYVTINSESFESGWGIWNDGGSDSYRSSLNANTGSKSFAIRDNTSTSVTTTDNLDLSAYEELTIDFSYVGVGMESGEDFWFQISTNGGSSYTTIESWARGTDFSNNVRENESVTITGTFTSTTKLRFRCDASVNNDRVYIDDVVVSGCTNSSRLIGETTPIAVVDNGIANETVVENARKSELNQMDLKVYPNPAREVLNLDFASEFEGAASIAVYDLSGRMVISKDIEMLGQNQRVKLDINDLTNGTYFVSLVSERQTTTKKFMVVR